MATQTHGVELETAGEKVSNMTTIMHRSFAKHMGFNWPREIACIVDGKPVTWAEIRANKTANQQRHLASILRCDAPRRAAHVWTFFVPGWIYGGWHLYIRTIKERWWIRECDELALDIMTMFPCDLLPIRENFALWKQTFAKTYARASDRQQGMVAGRVKIKCNGCPERFYC